MLIEGLYRCMYDLEFHMIITLYGEILIILYIYTFFVEGAAI